MHVTPQPPQLVPSLVMSTHAPAQSVSPVAQPVAEHAPEEHTWPAAHAVAQAPQCIGSDASDVHAPAQSVVPGEHTHEELLQI